MGRRRNEATKKGFVFVIFYFSENSYSFFYFEEALNDNSQIFMRKIFENPTKFNINTAFHNKLF